MGIEENPIVAKFVEGGGLKQSRKFAMLKVKSKFIRNSSCKRGMHPTNTTCTQTAQKLSVLAGGWIDGGQPDTRPPPNSSLFGRQIRTVKLPNGGRLVVDSNPCTKSSSVSVVVKMKSFSTMTLAASTDARFSKRTASRSNSTLNCMISTVDLRAKQAHTHTHTYIYI